MKEESNISAGTPPTNSVGTGVETSLPPASEPPGIPKGKKRKKKIYEAALVYAFKVTVADLGDIIVYAKNETQVKNKLRQYIRNSGGIINIDRVFSTDVIDFYTQKRAKAMKRLPDVVLEMSQEVQSSDSDPQAQKQELQKNRQASASEAQKRIQLAKQQAQKQLQAKKAEMQRNIANQQQALKQKSKTGSLNNQQVV